MKRFATAAIAGAFLAWGAPASAQSFGFGAHAGASIPLGDYSDAADLGFSGGLDLTMRLMAIAPALSWYTSVDAAGHSTTLDDADGGFLHFPIMTGLRLDAGTLGMIRPFLTGQLGLVVSRGPDLNGTSPDTETNFGFALGGGLQITDNVYAGLKWFNVGDVDFGYDTLGDLTTPVSFLDVYLGFGVR